MTRMPIGEICVRPGRHRRDLGDIAGLAESIGDIGLLHATTVDQHGNLLAGRRRLEAVRKLGWTSIPVHIVEAEPCS
jgi:ParB family chromosome partitioning protein